MKIHFTSLASTLVLFACASGTPESTTPAGQAPPAAPMEQSSEAAAAADQTDAQAAPPAEQAVTFESQVAEGGELYAANCAGCHGDSGQGSDKAPLLVGEGRLPVDAPDGRQRNVQFKTAMDVFQWVSKNMPPKAPGSFTPDQYTKVLAFALSANGVKLQEPLSADNAASIVINE